MGTLHMIFGKRSFVIGFALIGLVVWIVSHVPVVLYGTDETPLHVSYWTADEQSGVNGALHILKERSLLGLRNTDVLYYGPIMGLVNVPAPAIDFLGKYISGKVSSPEAYEDAIVWDWGGVLAWARVIAVIAGYIGLLGVFFLFRTNTFNPGNIAWVPFLATLVVASSYSYFIYTGFSRHWIFIVVGLVWQLYLATRIYEQKEGSRRHLWAGQVILTTISFGISYVGIMYQAFWIPLVLTWLYTKSWIYVKEFAAYIGASLVGMALMVWWHPYAFERILGLVGLRDVPQRVAELDLTNNTTAFASLGFYTQIILLAVLPLLVMTAFLVWRSRREGMKTVILRNPVALMFLVPTLASIAVFSIPDLHISRYVFPGTLLLILFFCAYASWAIAQTSNQQTRKLTLFFLSTFVILNVIQNIGWLRMVSAGPPERSSIVPQVIRWQEENPNARILFLKGWPLGVVHTNEAYRDFASRYNKGDSELWQYLTSNPAPNKVIPLNVYYVRNEESFAKEKSAYDFAVRHHLPTVGDDVSILSPTDEFEVRPWNVWHFKDFQESFEIVQ